MSASIRTVLVVDDEAEQRAMMRGILDFEAYAVLEASDYNEALVLQAKYPGVIDLLLIDIRLPGGDGCDLAQALLSCEPQLKVLYVSGDAGAELCKFFEMPVTDIHFLRKPFEPAELLRRVECILQSADPLAGTATAF